MKLKIGIIMIYIEHITNNASESFNKYLKKKKKLFVKKKKKKYF